MPSLPRISLNSPVDGPQRQVAGDRADHRRRAAARTVPHRLTSEAGPEQRQRDVVGQELGVEVDERQREQRPQRRRTRRSACHVGPEAPDRRRGERARQQLDQRIADEIGALQAEHLPRSTSQETTGMFSSARDPVPAGGAAPSAARPGCTAAAAGGVSPRSSAHCACQPRSSIFGRRWMTTLRKLPTHSPTTAATVMNTVGLATYRMRRSRGRVAGVKDGAAGDRL